MSWGAVVVKKDSSGEGVQLGGNEIGDAVMSSEEGARINTVTGLLGGASLIHGPPTLSQGRRFRCTPSLQ